MRKMNSRELEARLARAVEQSTPDVLEQVSSHPVIRLESLDEVVAVRPKTHRAIRRAALALCACLLLAACLGIFSYLRPAAYIDIDVNPSIEITANRYDRVLEVRALNSDAETVIGDMKLRNLDLDLAVNALIGSMLRHGYFSDGSGAVLISVTGGSEQQNLRLQQRVSQQIGDTLASDGKRVPIYTEKPETQTQQPIIGQPAEQTPSQASEDVCDRAKQNQISPAKQRLIDRLLRLNPSLDAAELSTMSIEELVRIAEVKDLDLDDDEDAFEEDDDTDNDDDDDAPKRKQRDEDEDDEDEDEDDD